MHVCMIRAPHAHIHILLAQQKTGGREHRQGIDYFFDSECVAKLLQSGHIITTINQCVSFPYIHSVMLAAGTDRF